LDHFPSGGINTAEQAKKEGATTTTETTTRGKKSTNAVNEADGEV